MFIIFIRMLEIQLGRVPTVYYQYIWVCLAYSTTKKNRKHSSVCVCVVKYGGNLCMHSKWNRPNRIHEFFCSTHHQSSICHNSNKYKKRFIVVFFCISGSGFCLCVCLTTIMIVPVYLWKKANGINVDDGTQWANKKTLGNFSITKKKKHRDKMFCPYHHILFKTSKQLYGGVTIPFGIRFKDSKTKKKTKQTSICFCFVEKFKLTFFLKKNLAVRSCVFCNYCIFKSQ